MTEKELVEAIAKTMQLQLEPHIKWEEYDDHEHELFRNAARESLSFLKYNGFIR